MQRPIPNVTLLLAALSAIGANAHGETAVTRESFSIEKAQEFANYSMLAPAYEQLLMLGVQAPNAEATVKAMAAHGFAFKLFRYQFSTAVVLNDSNTNTIHVSFDATTEFADKVDNAKFWPVSHKLGGKVHYGFNAVLKKEGPTGGTLEQAVRGAVAAFAAENHGPSTVDLCGFSKGGTSAIAFAAYWMTTNFANSPGLKLKEIYTFASPPLGDKTFVEKFDAQCRQHGITVNRVVAGRDTVPNLMTKDDAWYIHAMYAQQGEIYYLYYKDGTPTLVHNPDKATMLEIKNSSKDVKNWHRLPVYLAAIEKYKELHASVVEAQTPKKPVEVAAVDTPVAQVQEAQAEYAVAPKPKFDPSKFTRGADMAEFRSR